MLEKSHRNPSSSPLNYVKVSTNDSKKLENTRNTELLKEIKQK